MTEHQEGALVFTFPEDAQVGKIDSWAFYRNQFSKIQKTKAVDFVCVFEDECWLIEVKDYRYRPRTKTLEIADEIAWKSRDTLACLAAAARNANDEAERALATEAFEKARRRWRVALHLEWPPARRLHSGRDLASKLQMKLKNVVKGIDPHPVVGDSSRTRGPWSAVTTARP